MCQKICVFVRKFLCKSTALKPRNSPFCGNLGADLKFWKPIFPLSKICKCLSESCNLFSTTSPQQVEVVEFVLITSLRCRRSRRVRRKFQQRCSDFLNVFLRVDRMRRHRRLCIIFWKTHDAISRRLRESRVLTTIGWYGRCVKICRAILTRDDALSLNDFDIAMRRSRFCFDLSFLALIILVTVPLRDTCRFF